MFYHCTSTYIGYPFLHELITKQQHFQTVALMIFFFFIGILHFLHTWYIPAHLLNQIKKTEAVQSSPEKSQITQADIIVHELSAAPLDKACGAIKTASS